MDALLDGPFTYGDAIRHGLSKRDLTELRTVGEIVRPHAGVYLPASLASDRDARVATLAILLPPGAAVARESAAWLLGVDVRPPQRWQQPPRLECLVPLGAVRPQRPEVNAFVSDLPLDDVVDIGGIPCTTPTRTALDLARYRPRFIGLGAVDALTHAGMTTVAELEAAAAPLRGHRFIRRAREVIELCEPATESIPESWCRLRLVEAGLPRPTVQVSLRDDRGIEVFRLDMGITDAQIGIEYDGVEHHLKSVADREHDERRREDIRRLFRWETLAATSGDILGRTPLLEHAVMELLGVSIEFRRRPWGLV